MTWWNIFLSFLHSNPIFGSSQLKWCCSNIFQITDFQYEGWINYHVVYFVVGIKSCNILLELFKISMNTSHPCSIMRIVDRFYVNLCEILYYGRYQALECWSTCERMHAYMEYRTKNKQQLTTAPSSSLHNFSKTSVACATGPSVNRILKMEPNSGNTINK